MPKLTKRMIDEARACDRDVLLWDSTLPGFGLRVKPSGVKSFVLQYRTRERVSRRMTIGRYGVLTLEQAWKKAKGLLGEVSFGKDPALEKTEAGSGPTIADLARRYMREHCTGRCKPSTVAQHEWLLGKFILSALGSRRVKALVRSDLERLHQTLGRTPYNANRVLGLLKTMLNHAEQWGWRDAGSNPARLIKKYREQKKQRYLFPEELARLGATISAAERKGQLTAPAAAALRLLVLTGCRLNEILTLRWTAVDLDRRILLLERHKSDAKGAKTVPLSAPAVHLLRQIPRVDGNPYVVVGGTEGRHLVNPQKPWRLVRAEAGLVDVRLHDLRHSFASFGAGAGMSLPMIGGLLGHNSQQSTARYAHLSQEPLRHAAEALGGAIARGLGIPAPSEGALANPNLGRRRAAGDVRNWARSGRNRGRLQRLTSADSVL